MIVEAFISLQDCSFIAYWQSAVHCIFIQFIFRVAVVVFSNSESIFNCCSKAGNVFISISSFFSCETERKVNNKRKRSKKYINLVRDHCSKNNLKAVCWVYFLKGGGRGAGA